MSKDFVSNFLSVAHMITRADRGLAVDTDMQILAGINVTQANLDDPRFCDCAKDTLQKAINTGETIITNNLIMDQSQAPKTNVSLTDLRFVVGIPIPGMGAVYLDQPIRPQGVMSPQIIKSLAQLVAHIQTQHLEDSTPEEIYGIYQEII